MFANITPNSPGAKDLTALLDLISNAEEYQKRLSALQAAAVEAEKATAKLTKAKDLDRALKNAKEKQDRAHELSDKTHKQIEDRTNAAKRDAEKIVSDARGEADVFKEKVIQARKDLSNIDSQLQTAKGEKAQIEKEAEATREQSNKLILEAKAIKRNAKAKAKAVKDAMAAAEV